MTKIYHLECEPDGCAVSALINGLPYFKANGTNAPVIISKPINAVLIGNKNDIIFTIVPPFSYSEESSTELFSVNVKIKVYDNNDITGPEKGELIMEQKFINVLAGHITFNNELYNFSNRLKLSPKISKDDVFAYADRLRTVLKSENITNILSEFKEKLIDYAISYGDTTETMLDGFKDYLINYYLPNSPILDFSNEEIVLDSFCDDRIWQISVGLNRKEFMRTSPDSEGYEYVTKVFVAKIGHQISVIR